MDDWDDNRDGRPPFMEEPCEPTVWQRLSPRERDRLIAQTLGGVASTDDADVPAYTTDARAAVALLESQTRAGRVSRLTMQFEPEFDCWSAFLDTPICADTTTELHMIAETFPLAVSSALLGVVWDLDDRYDRALDATPVERWAIDALREPVAHLLATALLRDTADDLLRAYRRLGDRRHMGMSDLAVRVAKEMRSMAEEDRDD